MSACLRHHVRELFVIGAKQALAQNFYSLIAGFVEGSESLEGCVAREAFEEASVVVDPPASNRRQSTVAVPNQLMMDSAPPSSPIVSVR